MIFLDPRNRFDLVKDPVHGYIRFTKDFLSKGEKATEADLINSPWMQRLRRIHQLQMAWLVYPSADHTRFSHSLGVMEFAGKFARLVYEPYYNYNHGKMDGESLPQINYVVETFRIAGLLHDIGHGPLTHLLDSRFLIPKYGITHEDIGKEIISEELKDIIEGIRRSPDGIFEEKLDVDIICNLIKKGGETELEGIWRPLHQLIRGAYDADKMDFLLRDGQLSGEVGISYADIERLMYTTFLTKNSILALHQSSLPLLTSFIMFRQHMLEIVYCHRTVRAIELMVEETIEYIMEDLIDKNPIEDLKKYLEVDEYLFFNTLRDFKHETGLAGVQKKEVSKIWDQILKRNIKWKLLGESSIPIHDPRDIRPSLSKEELCNRIIESCQDLKPNEDFIVDSPSFETPINIFSYGNADQKDKIVAYSTEEGLTPRTIDNLVSSFRIPIKVLQYRLYVNKDVDDKKRRKLIDAFNKNLSGESILTSSLDSSF